MIKHYNKYILKNFIFCFIKVTIVFSAVVIVMNLLEEINFFKDDIDESILLPIFGSSCFCFSFDIEMSKIRLTRNFCVACRS